MGLVSCVLILNYDGVLSWHTFVFFLHALVAEPLFSHLIVSNVTWGSVSISWKAQEPAFDNFLVSNSDHPPGDRGALFARTSHSSVITDLKAASHYKAHLHGLTGGQHAQTLMVQATTGISLCGFFICHWTSTEPHPKCQPTPHSPSLTTSFSNLIEPTKSEFESFKIALTPN